MTELVQATKAYYSTVEGFVTGDPLLLNLRRMAGHIERERGVYDIGYILQKNIETCGDSLMNGHWEESFGKVEEPLTIQTTITCTSLNGALMVFSASKAFLGCT